MSLNAHRRHLSGEARRKLIAAQIKADPEKSDRQVAGELGASPTTVGTVRAEMEANGEVSKMDTRRDHRGHRQAAHKSTKARNAAGKATAHSAGSRNDVGADSASEAGRLRARCGELENVLQREKTRSLGLESEVTDLREAAARAQQKLNADLTDAELKETLARVERGWSTVSASTTLASFATHCALVASTPRWCSVRRQPTSATALSKTSAPAD